MDGIVSNIINATLVLLTAVGLWITVIQAKQAKAARDEAAKSAEDAAATLSSIAESSQVQAGASVNIAESSTRGAVALETIAAGGQPWKLDRVHPNGHEWLLRNVSNRVLHIQAIEAVNPEEQHYLVADFPLDEPTTWSPGESDLLRFDGGTLVDPPSLHIAIVYSVDGDDTFRRFKARI